MLNLIKRWVVERRVRGEGANWLKKGRGAEGGGCGESR